MQSIPSGAENGIGVFFNIAAEPPRSAGLGGMRWRTASSISMPSTRAFGFRRRYSAPSAPMRAADIQDRRSRIQRNFLKQFRDWRKSG